MTLLPLHLHTCIYKMTQEEQKFLINPESSNQSMINLWSTVRKYGSMVHCSVVLIACLHTNRLHSFELISRIKARIWFSYIRSLDTGFSFYSLVIYCKSAVTFFKFQASSGFSDKSKLSR